MSAKGLAIIGVVGGGLWLAAHAGAKEIPTPVPHVVPPPPDESVITPSGGIIFAKVRRKVAGVPTLTTGGSGTAILSQIKNTSRFPDGTPAPYTFDVQLYIVVNQAQYVISHTPVFVPAGATLTNVPIPFTLPSVGYGPATAQASLLSTDGSIPFGATNVVSFTVSPGGFLGEVLLAPKGIVNLQMIGFPSAVVTFPDIARANNITYAPWYGHWDYYMQGNAMNPQSAVGPFFYGLSNGFSFSPTAEGSGTGQFDNTQLLDWYSSVVGYSEVTGPGKFSITLWSTLGYLIFDSPLVLPKGGKTYKWDVRTTWDPATWTMVGNTIVEI